MLSTLLISLLFAHADIRAHQNGWVESGSEAPVRPVVEKARGPHDIIEGDRTRVHRQDEIINPNENPADVLSRFNQMKRDGQGRKPTAQVDRIHCVPVYKRQSLTGFRCPELPVDSGFVKAGVRADDVIVRVDGKSVSNAQAANAFLSKIENGDYREIVVLRNGRESSLFPPLR